MRILCFAPQPFFQDRGTPIRFKAMVDALVAHGHQVDVLTFHEGEDVDIGGGRIFRIPALPGLSNIRPSFSLKKVICDLLMLVRAVPILVRTRYDVIHAVEESAYLARLLKIVFRVPFVYDMHSSVAQQMVEKFPGLSRLSWALNAAERGLIKSSAGVVAVCRDVELYVRQARPDAHVVRLEDISFVGDTPAAPVAPLDVPGPVVMYVGNLEHYQGVGLLLEAFTRAVKQGAPGTLVIVGGLPEDVLDYRRRAADSGIADRVRFLGQRPVTELAGHLEQADILVSPRTHGVNTPMKIYNYLGSGRAVLATRLPTHTQVLDDSIACLVPPEPQAMAEGLMRLITDAEMRGRLGAAARERALAEHTFEAFSRKLTAFYAHIDSAAPSKVQLEGAGTNLNSALVFASAIPW
ncbi:glycosyltransferase family 4 protein [Indioceanicola profundi]|uniref:glycosyltransferase family 4 protein n=1 Tax=Indioceanicola profundi TaxID=2220096 RepID=UPI000E6ACCA8|nr:glycosyltransferase family 4 protein [Indioceanicola profundi]